MDPKWYLRLEAVAVAVAAVAAYRWAGGGLLLFLLLLFVPDFSAIGYVIGPATGALTYNLAHVYVGPLALIGIGLWAGGSLALQAGIVWLFHIGMDRSIGYGLKEGSFRDTHLGRMGRPARSGDDA